MRIIFILLALFCFFTNVSAQGFEWNSEYENQLRSSTAEIDISKTRSFLPSKSSLEKYIPFIFDQGETAMCVAYSLAYCRTIIYAKNKKLYKDEDIIANSFSPFYMYYNSKESSDVSCLAGIMPHIAILHAYNVGMAKLIDVEYPDYWPFTQKQLCNYYPPSLSTDNSIASKYKIDEPLMVSESASRTDKIRTLKNAINTGRPVFFGMDPMPPSLANSMSKDYWKPEYNEKSDDSIGHAMTIIAYDDYKYGGSFLILNSWGNEWGNKGKIWIRYENLVDYSATFVIIGKKYEKYIFGSPISETDPELDNSKLSSPSYISTDLIPPLGSFIIKK